MASPSTPLSLRAHNREILAAFLEDGVDIRVRLSGFIMKPFMRAGWELVVTCAGYHRLGLLLHEGLKRLPIEAPGFVATRLEKSFHGELAKAVVRLHHVETLKAASVRSGRPLGLLKGAAFAGSLYPNPASRPIQRPTPPSPGEVRDV